MKQTTVATIAELINADGRDRHAARWAGQAIAGVAALAEATPEQVSFCTDAPYAAQVPASRAAAIIVSRKLKIPDAEALDGRLLVVDDADKAVSELLAHLAPPIPRPAPGVDPWARVDASAQLGEGVRIGPFVTIGARVKLGNNCVLHSGVHLGDDVSVGDDCEIFQNVVVRERCTLGRRVIVHANSTIGTDGFGYRWDGRRHAKVPQIGIVVIADDVEIGSNTCIDRAKFAATVVGPGTKIDNLVQVGHNVKIGAHCIIVGQTGLAGSVQLGNGVILGGQSAIRDHLKLGDGAMVAACSAVADDVDAKMIVSGLPALPHRQSLREQGALRRLPELVQQMRKVSDDVEQLKRRAGMAPGESPSAGS